MTRRSWTLVIVAFGLAVGLAYALRFLLVENQGVVADCSEHPAAPLCGLREATIFAFHELLLGSLALAGGLLALLHPRAWPFLAALLPAGFALVLYNVALGATAVMLCVLATARAGARRAPA